MFKRVLQALLLTSCTLSVQAEVGELEFEDPFYVGLGLGVSFLEPETNSVALTLAEDSDIAYKIFGGYRFDRNWSIEAFWANLGEAEIAATSGNNLFVEYKTFGVGGAYTYALNDRWSVFAKTGVGRLDTKLRNAALERVEDYYVFGGVGATWNMTGTWDLRAEYEYFDTDAQLLSFNVIKRFGSESSRRINKLEKRVEHQEKLLATSSIASVVEKHSDCGEYSVVLEGVIFPGGSIALTDESKQAIDAIIIKLKALPEDIRFEIRAHTDDRGSELYNYTLSLSRARNVRDYIAEQGISLDRIDAQGYGEWRPRRDNNIEGGRYWNRRAELVLLGVEKYVDDTGSCPQPTSSPVHAISE